MTKSNLSQSIYRVVLLKRGFNIHLQNVSTQVSLRNPRRLTLGRNVLLLVKVLHAQELFYAMDQSVLKQKQAMLSNGFIERTHFQDVLTLSQTSPGFYVSAVQAAFENTVGKGEIARNEQFLLFPQCFLTFWRTFFHFHKIKNCRPQTISVWKRLKFVVWVRVKARPV